MLNYMISWNFFIILLFFGALYFLAKKLHNNQRGPLRQYNNDLRGKIIIITGCSSGIGKKTACQLAKLGGTIIFANRNQQKSDLVMKQIQDQTKNNNLHFIRLDTSDYQSVHCFVEEFLQRFDRIDILINNAGIAYETTYNKHGHETVIATNYLGPFLLTNLLLKTIVNTKQSRIINVSSKAINSVKKSFDLELITTNCQNQLHQYAISKVCNVFFTNELQNKFDEHKVDSKTVSLHPGVVNTEIFTKVKLPMIFRFIYVMVFSLGNWYFLSEEEGAMTTIYTALMDYNELSPAGYYKQNALSSATQFVRNSKELQKQVWMTSEKLINIKSIL